MQTQTKSEVQKYDNYQANSTYERKTNLSQLKMSYQN